ncbi:MAG: hypothetical protein B1H04_00315 [Planctomycetales bacterium 4484_123]|nr:MAG: hypothetical protein B1H04_00315 [Planctomycetales bacterium 4484_123]
MGSWTSSTSLAAMLTPPGSDTRDTTLEPICFQKPTIRRRRVPIEPQAWPALPADDVSRSLTAAMGNSAERRQSRRAS